MAVHQQVQICPGPNCPKPDKANPGLAEILNVAKCNLG